MLSQFKIKEKLRKRNFYNFPEHVNLLQYEETIQIIMSFLKKEITSFYALYQYGAFKHPGLSDLDLILVLDEKKINKNDIKKIKNFKINNQVSKICKNSFFKIMTVKQFKKIYILGNINLKKINGKKILIKGIPKKDKYFYDYCNIIDWLPERMITISNHFFKKKISVIKLIGDIYSFSHSVRLYNKYFTNNHIKKYLLKIEKIRNNWFNFKNKNKIDLILEISFDSIDIGKIMIKKLDSLELIKGNIKNISNVVFYYNSKQFLYFTNFFILEKRNIYKKTIIYNNSIRVPFLWLKYIFLLSSIKNNDISKVIKKNIKIDANNRNIIKKHIQVMPKNLKTIATKRVNLSDEIYKFINDNLSEKKYLYRYGHLEKVN